MKTKYIVKDSGYQYSHFLEMAKTLNATKYKAGGGIENGNECVILSKGKHLDDKRITIALVEVVRTKKQYLINIKGLKPKKKPKAKPKAESDHILQEAFDIIGKSSKSRNALYGNFEDCMDRAAKIASVATGKNIETKDMYMILVSLKMAREVKKHKRDNLLDICGYIGGLQQYYEDNKDMS